MTNNSISRCRCLLVTAVLSLSHVGSTAAAFFVTPTAIANARGNAVRVSSAIDDNGELDAIDRRRVLEGIGLAGISLTVGGSPVQAKVEGYAPPKKALSEEYRQGTAALGDSDENAPVPKEAYKKLPSGVIYADLRVGGGETADVGKKANIQWVLRKSNGYFVDSSEVSGGVPFIFTVGDKGAIAGMDEGIRGMKVGGTRRILIPPSLAYVEGLEDGKPGPLPAGFGPRQQMKRVQGARKDVPGEYLYFEIQLTKIR